jgi:hypothetical protein
MVAKNDITGDAIKTRAGSAAYVENYQRIFGDKKSGENRDSESETKQPSEVRDDEERRA